MLIKNGKFIENNRYHDGDILIEGERIKAIGTIDDARHQEIIDAENKIIIPGLIDIHIHGAIGFDVLEASPEELNQIANFLKSQGTTSFLPTIITARDDQLFQALHNIKKANHPSIVGVHLEGPYINKNKKGCHDENLIKNPEIELIKKVNKILGNLHSHYTIAPELPNALAFINKVTKKGGTISLGHSDATKDESIKALNTGAKIFTHLFNAMRPLHHREPGIIGAALNSDRFVEVISDGVHVDPEILKIIYRLKGNKKIVLVTDAMQACGLGDGNYHFGGFNVIVNEGIARKEDGTLASSTLTMFKALKLMMQFINIPLEEAIDMATINPAKVIGIEQDYGSISVGKIADLLILDNNLNIETIIHKGKKEL